MVFRALVQPQTIIAADGAAPRLFQNFKKRFPRGRIAARPQARAIRIQVCSVYGPASGFRFLQSLGLLLCQYRGIARQPLERGHGGEVVGTEHIGIEIGTN